MPIKILLVEPIASMQRIIKHLLAQVGYTQVGYARETRQAIAMLRQGTFRLVIAAWNIPPHGGLAFLQTIRNDSELQGLPVFLILEDIDKAQVQAAMQAGVTTLLVKPFNAAVLQEKIAALFPRQTVPEQGSSAVPQALFSRSR
jgi:two-component system chemotaxis response regulator CheY